MPLSLFFAKMTPLVSAHFEALKVSTNPLVDRKTLVRCDRRHDLRGLRAFPLGPAWRQAISSDRHKFGFAKRRERGAGPAAPPPGVVGRRERVGSDSAFERLLIRCEFDVGAELVWSKRRESDARLEGAAVEMGMFAGPLERERDAAKKSAASAIASSGFSD
jgi:hypothetical protein